MKNLVRAAVTLAAALSIAITGSVAAYSGRGSDNLPCTTGGYWVINHLTGPAPTLIVGGVNATLVKQPNATIAHYISGPVTAATVVVVSPNVGQLQLSHCLPGPTATPTPSPTPTPSITPSPTPSTDPTPSPTGSESPTDSARPNLTPPPTDTALAVTTTGDSSPFGMTFWLAVGLVSLFVIPARRSRRR
jgi:hypothetical protein